MLEVRLAGAAAVQGSEPCRVWGAPQHHPPSQPGNQIPEELEEAKRRSSQRGQGWALQQMTWSTATWRVARSGQLLPDPAHSWPRCIFSEPTEQGLWSLPLQVRNTRPRERKVLWLAVLGSNSALTHWPYHTKGQTQRRERTKARQEAPHKFSVPPCVLLKGLGCPQQGWLKIGRRARRCLLSERCPARCSIH